ncbi:hypothetical protein FXO38_22790 [Capsicum annuum]|nr:hypothetical protein FXO38_22790 [Capsicum annuum]KAF3669711.1 hypothetical protein FXO37_08880 [Capsicum annuum]
MSKILFCSAICIRFNLKLILGTLSDLNWMVYQWQGIHLDPSIYLMDEENKLPSASPANQAGPKSTRVEEQNELQQKSNSNVRQSSQSDRKDFCSEDMNSEPGEESSELNKFTTALKSLDVHEISENMGKCLSIFLLVFPSPLKATHAVFSGDGM